MKCYTILKNQRLILMEPGKFQDWGLSKKHLKRCRSRARQRLESPVLVRRIVCSHYLVLGHLSAHQQDEGAWYKEMNSQQERISKVPRDQQLSSGRSWSPIPTFKASLIPRPITRVCTPFLTTSSTSAGCTPGECWVWKEKVYQLPALWIFLCSWHSCGRLVHSSIHSLKKGLLAQRITLCQALFGAQGITDDTVLPLKLSKSGEKYTTKD